MDPSFKLRNFFLKTTKAFKELKQKEDIKDDDKLKMKLKLLAKTYQMSIREVELFANYHNIDLKKVEVS